MAGRCNAPAARLQCTCACPASSNALLFSQMYAWELSDRQRFAKQRATRLPPAVAAGGGLDFSLQPVPARWRRLLWLFAALAPPAILLAAHGFEQASCAGGAVVY